MAGVGNDLEIGEGKKFFQFPGGIHRANDIVSAVDEDGRDMGDLGCVFEKLVVVAEETLIDEVMAFNAGKSLGEPGIVTLVDELLVDDKARGRSFPDAPTASGGDAHIRIGASETLVVGLDEVVALVGGNMIAIGPKFCKKLT